MTTLAKDTARQTRFGGLLAYDNFPVSASQKIYQGALVGMDSTGNVLPATDSASLTGVGVAVAQSDNTSGASGDLTVNIYTSGEIALPYTGSPTYGSTAYVYDSGTVAPSGSITNGVYVGKFKESHETLSGYKWVELVAPAKSGTPVA